MRKFFEQFEKIFNQKGTKISCSNNNGGNSELEESSKYLDYRNWPASILRYVLQCIQGRLRLVVVCLGFESYESIINTRDDRYHGIQFTLVMGYNNCVDDNGDICDPRDLDREQHLQGYVVEKYWSNPKYYIFQKYLDNLPNPPFAAIAIFDINDGYFKLNFIIPIKTILNNLIYEKK